MRVKLAGAASAAALLVLAGCATADNGDGADEPVDASDEMMDESMDEPMDDAMGDEMASGTIVDVAAGNDDFSTLVAAVSAAGLVDTLNGDGPFTVFAPSNAAFDALPDGVLDALLEEANKDVLVKILTYHVLPGEVTADMVTAGDVATVEGQNVTITTDDGGVQVNGANVVVTDVDASNGVIHAIDAVILPPDVDPAALVG